MKKLFYLALLFSFQIDAQIYKVELELKHQTKYTSEFIEKEYGGNNSTEIQKWNREQNENPKPLDYIIYSTKNEQNSIEQEKIDNSQEAKGGVKKSVVGLPFGLTYTDFKTAENYRKVDVYGNKYIVKVPLEKLEWKFTDETKEILGYKVYKATSTYLKHQVIAWYTKDIAYDFIPIAVHPFDGFVLEMNLYVEIPEVGRMDNFVQVKSIKEIEKYKFINPIQSDKKSKLTVVSLDELTAIYDEANRKRNEMFNQDSGIDKK